MRRINANLRRKRKLPQKCDKTAKYSKQNEEKMYFLSKIFAQFKKK